MPNNAFPEQFYFVLCYLYLLLLTADFKVRLAGSQEEGSGRVEILYHGVWGTINGRSIDHVTKGAAAVVCRELGYPRAVLSGYGSFGAGSGPVWLNRWRSLECLGNETNLAKCNWKIDKIVYSHHSSDWFVVCDVPGSTDNLPKPPGLFTVMYYK